MKPEAILFYNENKTGVDFMDQMVTHFTTKRSTRRWTFAFFCNMLDNMTPGAFCCNLPTEKLYRKAWGYTYLERFDIRWLFVLFTVT